MIQNLAQRFQTITSSSLKNLRQNVLKKRVKFLTLAVWGEETKQLLGLA
jgi:hypothetical protein